MADRAWSTKSNGDAACFADASVVPNLGTGRQAYAAGFLLSDDGHVVAIRKNRPAWQAGKLNGVGGHVEAGETPLAAMRREFREEAGLDLPEWEHYATVTFPAGAVWFFRLFTTRAMLGHACTRTDEVVGVYRVADLLDGTSDVIPNVRWLLALASYRHDSYLPVIAQEQALS